MLKYAHVRYFGDSRRTIKVAYVMTTAQCVFTATTKTPSSINAAEDIICEICRVENRRPETLRFFDLQTHLGYTGKDPGEFHVDELLFSTGSDGRVTVNDWDPRSTLPAGHEIFSQFIGTP